MDWCDGQFEISGVNAFNTCFQLSNVNHLSSVDSITDWNELSHHSFLFGANKHKGVYDLYRENENSIFKKLRIDYFPFSWAKKLKRNWIPLLDKNKRLPFGSDLSINLKEDVVYFVDFLPTISYNDLPNYINLIPEIKKKVNDFSVEYRLKEAIGVHVRFTDKKPTRQLSTLIEYLQSENSDKVFLSTDSNYVQELFQKTFNNLIIFPKTTPQLSGEGLHQWALYNNKEELKHIIYEESVIEMFLLSNCNKLLYQGNSTFSKISKTYHPNLNNCLDWQIL